MEATIEGDLGEFFGIVHKSSNLPDGVGVFKSGDWLHCGKFKAGLLQDSRKVSVNREARLLKLTNQKCLADGSVLQKLERFSNQGVERDFLKDGQKIAKIIPRLNRLNDD